MKLPINSANARSPPEGLIDKAEFHKNPIELSTVDIPYMIAVLIPFSFDLTPYICKREVSA